jgi:hypothetical protein
MLTLRDTLDDLRLRYHNIPREVLDANHLESHDVHADAYYAWLPILRVTGGAILVFVALHLAQRCVNHEYTRTIGRKRMSSHRRTRRPRRRCARPLWLREVPETVKAPAVRAERARRALEVGYEPPVTGIVAGVVFCVAGRGSETLSTPSENAAVIWPGAGVNGSGMRLKKLP